MRTKANPVLVLYQLCYKMIDKEILKLPILFRIYFRKVNAENYTAINIKFWWNADGEVSESMHHFDVWSVLPEHLCFIIPKQKPILLGHLMIHLIHPKDYDFCSIKLLSRYCLVNWTLFNVRL